MKKLSEVPFISISNENLMAAADMLDREQMGELMEMIIDAVLNDGQPSSDNKCVNGVFKQFMAVIERKAKGYAKRVEPLEKVNEERKKQQEEPQVSTFTEPTTTQPVETNSKVEDESFNKFLEHFHKIEVKFGRYEMELKLKDLCDKEDYDFNWVRGRYYNKYPIKNEVYV